MANLWANHVKAGQVHRLDPCHLPQTVIYDTLEKNRVLTCALNERGATITGLHDCAATSLSRIIPAHQFKGVAARIVAGEDGHNAVALELLHEQKDLCIPLLVSRDLDDVLLDWRLWSDTYDLPMLLLNEDGYITPVKDRSPLEHFFARTQAKTKKSFMLRCRGASLGIKLMINNQIMLG